MTLRSCQGAAVMGVPEPHTEFSPQIFSDHLFELWAPQGPRRRIAATTAGLAEIEILDRFSEQIIDLHWQALAAYFTFGNREQLTEFRGLEFDGHRLVSFPEDLDACLRWAEE
jgi:hypothetical protein